MALDLECDFDNDMTESTIPQHLSTALVHVSIAAISSIVLVTQLGFWMLDGYTGGGKPMTSAPLG